jgi:hypothetical protein
MYLLYTVVSQIRVCSSRSKSGMILERPAVIFAEIIELGASLQESGSAIALSELRRIYQIKI